VGYFHIFKKEKNGITTKKTKYVYGFKSHLPHQNKASTLCRCFFSLIGKWGLKPKRVFAVKKIVRWTIFQQKGVQSGTKTVGLGRQAVRMQSIRGPICRTKIKHRLYVGAFLV